MNNDCCVQINHRHRPSFEKRCEEYSRFVSEHKRQPKQQSLNGKESSLAKWVSNIRYTNNCGELSVDKIDKLETLIDWSWGISFNQSQPIQKKQTTTERGYGRINHPKFLEHVKELNEWVNSHGGNYPTISENKTLYGFFISTKNSYDKYNKNKNKYGIRIDAVEKLPNWSWEHSSRKRKSNKCSKSIMSKKRTIKKKYSKMKKRTYSNCIVQKMVNYLGRMNSKLSEFKEVFSNYMNELKNNHE